MAGALYFLFVAVVLIVLGLFVLTPIWVIVVAGLLIVGWFVLGGMLVAMWANRGPAGRGAAGATAGTPTTEEASYDPTRVERQP